jgi:hypothetical protein
MPVSVGRTDTLLGRGLMGRFVLRDRFTGTVPPNMPLVGLVLPLLRFSSANPLAVFLSDVPIVEVELPVE